MRLDENKYVAAILMDLSKAFDYLPHDLLFLQLKAYGVSKNAIKLLKSYLINRKQCVKLGTFISDFPVKYFTDRSKAVLLLWIFYVFVLSCVCYVLCASVYMCFVVTCWERADLMALVCGVLCQFVTFPLVSWVRCGT